MAATASSLRQVRERELVTATRALFDQRGMQDAPIEEIAKAVGIARGLIYRHFSSKEELFVLTVTDYLDELAGLLETAVAGEGDQAARLERCTEAYADFCRRYPAFLDSSMALMHRPARELREIVSESVWFRLGQAMVTCIDYVTQILRAGNESGEFDVADPDYTANVLWTQMLGAMHLTRIRIGLRQAAPGIPGAFRIDADRVIGICVDSALATVGAKRSRKRAG
jgi:AcrR family transcriptional regulator